MPPADHARLPYPGLRCFEAYEADLFFGREEHVDALLERLSRSHFVAVVGESGAGKSSLVRAGLRPALDAGFVVEAGSDWRVAVLRPGSAPLEALADTLLAPGVLSRTGGVPRRDIALAELHRGPLGLVQLIRDAHLDPHCNVLIVVDQFEELFRYCRAAAQGDDANVFVELLLRASCQRDVPVFVVLTMRSDFVGECARFRGLPEMLNDNQYLTPRLTREQIARAIREPARVCGGVVESPLVDELCNAAGDHQDQLPLLQHLLMRAWERACLQSNPPRLGVDLARDMGGLTSALNNHAQQVYEGLSGASRQLLARAMFKRLTDPHAQRRDLRRDALVSEIAAVAAAPVDEVIAVADAFRAEGCHMLMPPPAMPLDGSSRIDISHETLLRQWATLAEWSREEGCSAHEFERLLEEAQRERAGDGELLTGRDLARAQDWMKQAAPTEAWACRYAPAGSLDVTIGFIQRSGEQAQQQKNEKARAAAREARRQKMVTAGAVALAAAVAVVAMVILVLYSQTKSQGHQLEIALDQAQKEKQAALKAKSDADTSAEEARIKKVEAVEKGQEAEEHKRDAEERRAHADAIQLAANARVELRSDPGLAILLARKALVSGLKDPWAVRALRVALADHVPGVESPFKTAKSRIFVRKAGTSEWVNFALAASSISARDNSIVIPSGNMAVIWSRASSPNEVMLGETDGHTNVVASAAFSPNGEMVATSSADGTVRLWARTGAAIGRPLAHGALVNSAVFNDDGSLLLSGADNNRAVIWRVNDSERRCEFQRPENVNFIGGGFSADRRHVVTTTHDNGELGARVWDIGTCREVPIPKLQQIGSVRSADFSPDGRWLGVVTVTGKVVVFDTMGWTVTREIATHPAYKVDVKEYPPPEAFPPPLAWSHRHIAFAGADHVVRLTTVDGSDVPVELRGHTANITSIVFHPAGDRLLTTSVDRTARVWQLSRDTQPVEVAVLRGHRDTIGSGAFSPTGEVFTAGNDEKVRSWNPRFALTQVHVPGIKAATLSPDGTGLIVSATQPGTNGDSELTISSLTGRSLATRQQYIESTSSRGHVVRGVRIFASEAGGISVRDARTPATAVRLADSAAINVKSIGVSPNGRFAFAPSSARDDTAVMWNLERPHLSPTHHRDPSRGDGPCKAEAISSAGRIAWYCANLDRIMIERPDRGEPLSLLLIEKTRLESLRFSTTGRWLAATFKDTSALELIDTLQQRKPNAMVRGSDRPIVAVAFSRDDRFVVSATDDANAKVWDVENAVEIAGFSGQGRPRLTDAMFSRDGLTIVFVAADQVLSWRCYGCGENDDLLREVRRRDILRKLTIEQEERFGITTRELNSDRPHSSDHAHPRS